MTSEKMPSSVKKREEEKMGKARDERDGGVRAGWGWGGGGGGVVHVVPACFDVSPQDSVNRRVVLA